MPAHKAGRAGREERGRVFSRLAGVAALAGALMLSGCAASGEQALETPAQSSAAETSPGFEEEVTVGEETATFLIAECNADGCQYPNLPTLPIAKGSPGGTLTVLGADGARVTFTQGGRIVNQGTVKEGSLSLDGIEEGQYSLLLTKGTKAWAAGLAVEK